jgi:5'-methylthioadenosine phosphorylase
MSTERIGIIGGSGLGDALLQRSNGREVDVETPFGPPSSRPLLATWEGVETVFISRHGPGHRFNPSQVPYRANIWAMKLLGVRAILASGATGSLREDVEPGHLMICDQVIDRTFRRRSTFFDEGVVAHVEFAEPFCPAWRRWLAEAGRRVPTTVHHAGVYVCMEGPQFSTKAESQMHRQWGGDLIGMTCLPEAKLAREAELCYALIALPTDYDCWRPHEPGAAPQELLKEILSNLRRATDHAIALIGEVLKVAGRASVDCACGRALELAIWSDKSRLDPTVRERLRPLIGRYLPDGT